MAAAENPENARILARLMFEQAHLLEPSMALRGLPPTRRAVPIGEPNGPVRLPLNNQRNRSPQAALYRELMSNPTTLDRLRRGIIIPDGPVRKKDRAATSLLTGLAHGFKFGGGPNENDKARRIQGLMLDAGYGQPGSRSFGNFRGTDRSLSEAALARKYDAQTEAIKAGRAPSLVASDRALERTRNAQAEGRERAATSGGKSAGDGSLELKRKIEALDKWRRSQLSKMAAGMESHFGSADPKKNPGGKGAAEISAKAQARGKNRVEEEYSRRLKELREGTSGGAGGGSGVVAGVDISRYAPEPDHEANVARLYQQIDAYIQEKAPGSPVTGQMVVDAAEEYDVDPALVVAIIQQDSAIGTKGVGARTNNPGNVGTDIPRMGKVTSFDSVFEGVRKVAAWLKRHKVAQAPAEAAPAKPAPKANPKPLPKKSAPKPAEKRPAVPTDW